MKVSLLGEMISYENSRSSVDDLFGKIGDIVRQAEYTFTHIIVNGEEIYEDFHTFLYDHIDEIDVIEVCIESTNQLIRDLFIATEQQLRDMIPGLSVLSSDFYSGNQSAWGDFSRFIESVEWLGTMIKTFDSRNVKMTGAEHLVGIMHQIEAYVIEMEDAIQGRDMIQIADALQFEISPLLVQFQHRIQQTIDNEVIRHDLN